MSKQKKQQRGGISPQLLKRIEIGVLLAIAGLLYYHAKHFEFVQDDSFITFRYVKNLVDGHGLVFNIGERVEGYTTFLWTVLLAAPAVMGFELITLSQVLGVLFGLATLYIVYRLSLDLAKEQRAVGFSLIAVLLLASNSGIAYWLISGMETGMFMFLTVLSVWLYLRERNSDKNFAYAPLAFVLVSLTRPEGMYLFGLTMIHFVAEKFFNKEKNKRKEFKRILVWGALYAIPIGLFMAWRLSYYGYLFPNTYYAKAGFSKEYFFAGVDYFWQFAQMDLLWGALLVVPIALLLWKKRTWEMLYLIFLILAYTSYIVSVGGDVLANFRFFIPLLPLIYLLAQEGFYILYSRFEERRSMLKHVIYVAPLALAYVTYSIPYEHVRRYCDLEIGLVAKMTEQGKWFKEHSAPDAVIAATTIGAVSYYAELTLIDMLGLTDETIAHHPEPLEDLQSGWKERHHNATYVLSRKPQWILFSTGYKPSAFAERALFTKKEFRQWYHQYYFHPAGDVENIGIVYKRADLPLVDSNVVQSGNVQNQFINDYYDGVNRISRWPNDALEFFKKSEAAAPPDFAMLYEALGQTYLVLKNTQEAIKYYEKAISIDPRLIESNRLLGTYALQTGNTAKAMQYLEALVKVDPDYSYAWTIYGQALATIGDLNRAQAAFQKAMEVAPNNGDASALLQRLARRG